MEGQLTFEFNKRPTIKGYPELRWTGKRPYAAPRTLWRRNQWLDK